MEKRRQNVCLDFWKGLACFGVVFFHIGVPDRVTDGVIQAALRFSMPLFFMISGYYSYYENKAAVLSKLPGKIKNIWKISWIGCAYYACFNLAIGLFGDSHGGWGAAADRFLSLFTVKTMTDWILFNQDPFINLMWFTFALLYCYLILYLVAKYEKYKIAYGMIPILILIHLILGNFLDFWGIQIQRVFYRNFLLYGFPFFFLGNWCHYRYDRITGLMSIPRCLLMIGAGTLFSVSEWFLYGRQELYVGSVLMVIGIFCFTMLAPDQRIWTFVGKIGKDYSLFIYIVHYSLISIFDRLTGYVMEAGSTGALAYGYIKSILIFGTCIPMAVCCRCILETWKRRKSKL